MKHFLAATVVTLSMLAASAPGPAAPTADSRAGAKRVARVDQSSAIVELKGAPIAASDKAIPAHGKRIDFSSSTVKNYRAQLAATAQRFPAVARQNAPQAKLPVNSTSP